MKNKWKGILLCLAVAIPATAPVIEADDEEVAQAIFAPIKTLSKFFIVLAMSAVGLNTDLVKLVKSGAKPLLLGFSCWAMITVSTLALQSLLGLR